MKILKQGVHYDVPSKVYHADCGSRPSLSSSIAVKMIEESPEDAMLAHPRLNPDHEEVHKKIFDIGTAAHVMLCERTTNGIVAVKPENFPSAGKEAKVPGGWTNGAIKAERARIYASGMTPILQKEFDELVPMVARAKEFMADTKYAESFERAKPEVTILFTDEASNGQRVLCRVRLDLYDQLLGIVYDYKTGAGLGNPRTFEQRAKNLKYPMKSMLYARGVNCAGLPFQEFVFLHQSTKPPFACSISSLSPEMEGIAVSESQRAIDLWQRCLKAKKWPSFGHQLNFVEAKPWDLAAEEMLGGN